MRKPRKTRKDARVTNGVPLRRLGHSGIEVSALRLGCMGMSELYGQRPDEARSMATLQRALDLGINFLDTADVYGPFTNEELVGRFVRSRRHQVVVATKFGNMRAADGTFLGISGQPDCVRRCCDAHRTHRRRSGPRSTPLLTWRQAIAMGNAA
jgi:aryl-alcohol dehydrogenase-like predicted oxidoreductase